MVAGLVQRADAVLGPLDVLGEATIPAEVEEVAATEARAEVVRGTSRDVAVGRVMAGATLDRRTRAGGLPIRQFVGGEVDAPLVRETETVAVRLVPVGVDAGVLAVVPSGGVELGAGRHGAEVGTPPPAVDAAEAVAEAPAQGVGVESLLLAEGLVISRPARGVSLPVPALLPLPALTVLSPQEAVPTGVILLR